MVQNLKTADWFRKMGVVQPEDTIQMALEAMHSADSPKTFVVDDLGYIVGSIDFINILRKIVLFEQEERKQSYFASAASGEDA